MKTDLQQLAALLEKATPAPWGAIYLSGVAGDYARVSREEHPIVVPPTVVCYCRDKPHENAALIVAAINFLSTHLSTIESLQGEVERMREALEEIVRANVDAMRVSLPGSRAMRVDEEALELAAQAVYECNAGTMTWAEIKGRTREADCRHEAEEAITAYLTAIGEKGMELMPRDPTEAMLEVGRAALAEGNDPATIWLRMFCIALPSAHPSESDRRWADAHAKETDHG